MPALVERPKMSRAMWDALKSHIMKERQKKKQEQEADEAIERQRLERENKQKQDVMTLEETKEQISQLKQKMQHLTDEKHELFIQLKKVLNEDATRQRALSKESNDMIMSHHGYSSSPIQLGGQPPMFVQGGIISGRPSMYKLGIPPGPSVMIPPGMKRARSPSPPPVSYQQPYNFKAQVAADYNRKPAQYQAAPSSAYYPQSHVTTSSSYAVNQAAAVYSYSPGHAQFPPAGAVPQPQQPNPAEVASAKIAQQHGYHISHLPQPGFPQQLHQSMEHANHKSPYGEEKYYNVQLPSGVQIRGVAPLQVHAGIPIQQQSKPGGITAGYPIRGHPTSQQGQNPSYQPPPTSTPQHVQSVVYSTHQTPPRHAYPGQPTARFY